MKTFLFVEIGLFNSFIRSINNRKAKILNFKNEKNKIYLVRVYLNDFKWFNRFWIWMIRFYIDPIAIILVPVFKLCGHQSTYRIDFQMFLTIFMCHLNTCTNAEFEVASSTSYSKPWDYFNLLSIVKLVNLYFHHIYSYESLFIKGISTV